MTKKIVVAVERFDSFTSHLIGLSSGLDLAFAMLAGEFDSHTIHCGSPMLV